MMKIDVAELKKDVGLRQPFSFTLSTGDLFSSEEHWLLDGDVMVEGEAEACGDRILLCGIIKAAAACTCDRCLIDFTKPVEISFSEEYREGESSDPDLEMETALFQGDEIDLAELLRESILMAKPLKTVCREDCRGLCPHCGADLNQGACACEQSEVDPRLAALKNFLSK